MKKKVNKQLDRFIHYWMCGDCATKMGGTFPEGHCCTAMTGECKYCHAEKVTLIPYVDFDWKDINTKHLRD